MGGAVKFGALASNRTSGDAIDSGSAWSAALSFVTFYSELERWRSRWLRSQDTRSNRRRFCYAFELRWMARKLDQISPSGSQDVPCQKPAKLRPFHGLIMTQPQSTPTNTISPHIVERWGGQRDSNQSWPPKLNRE